ncbi:uncharacterized protein LAESUDRAFT_722994 [Laetiporus sulphureus 93-53]|uniref:DUF6533 domain-containing protein n=1 Tax=Laetiporus sulphureus 93-53 TaxID=1314785 RepID=A0A165FP48_9APHY|nr:uncharacterized protein LAESUDRAFT_722994 [Laetiporus sulphureus 93-53]KZT09263.1 hypothetical protein LAESUDRAFT_722994 [Laetiporus sulphureus 93-53]
MSVVMLVKEATSITEEAIASNCCYIAAATLIFYEHLTTFSDEIDLVWTSKWTTVTVVFMCNRSLLVMLGATFILNVLPWDTQAVISIFSALRVYAISIHKWVPTLLVFLLSVAPTGVMIYILSTTSRTLVGALDGLAACVGHTPIPPETQQKLVMTLCICAVLADLVALLVTWASTFQLAREARHNGTRAELVQLLLRDGTLYFVALLTVDILELSVEYSYTDPQSDGTYVSPLRLSFSSILISRFLLNLRRVHNSADSLIPQVDIHLSSIGGLSMASFGSRLIDILGTDLDFEPSAESDDYGRQQTRDAGDRDRERGSLIEMQVPVRSAGGQQGS